MEDHLIHKAQYQIRTREIGPDKTLTIPSLIELLQETSMRHVQRLGASFWDLNGKSWVLLSKKVIIHDLPQLGDRIEVITYPSGFDRIFAYRDYKVYDILGKEIVTVTSIWTLIDIDSRKVVKIPNEIYRLAIPENQKVVPRGERKIRIPDKVKLEKGGNYQMGYFTLDWNGHVNNLHLIKILLEDNYTLLEKRSIGVLSLCFIQEALMLDKLTIYNSTLGDGVTYHKIEKNNNMILQARIDWKANK